jgi:hypothetical protein
VLDVLVPEVVLEGARVVAVIRELEPTGMAKHVRVDREWHLGGLADALDEAVETDGADWSATFLEQSIDRARAYASLCCDHPGQRPMKEYWAVGSICPAFLEQRRALVCVGRVRGKLVRHHGDYSVFL